MTSRRKSRGWSVVDWPKLYVFGAFGGILLAIVGVWLTPVSTAIGRREFDVLYGFGWFSLAAGTTLALLCILLIVLDT